MTTPTYQPTRITPRVTAAHKQAVWASIAPPARLTVREIAAATGIDLTIVYEVIAMGRAAGRIAIHDDDRQHVWIGRKAAAA